MTAVDPAAEARYLGSWLAETENLRQRRFEKLAVSGGGAPMSEPQGRVPGDGTTPDDLIDLISSIAEVGLLQPILVEELPNGYRIVAGERRYRAIRWGAVNPSTANNPHFESVPAIVCPGPLSDEERYRWALIENLAREDLQPAELGAALLYERCALLTRKLEAAGIPIAKEANQLEDPVERWRALDRIRVQGGMHNAGAPWPEVLQRIGIDWGPPQTAARKAADLVRALIGLPDDIAAEMDTAQISLTCRLEYLKLRGRDDARDDLWAAVKDRGRIDLLPTAVRLATANHVTDVAPSVLLDAAEKAQEAANEARALSVNAQTRPAAVLDADTVTAFLAQCDAVIAHARNGGRFAPYDAGSLLLKTAELNNLVRGLETEEAAA